MKFKALILKLQRGFTLIELLITMAVLGILLAVALPNLQTFVVSTRLSSDVNGFIGLLNYARSEAITRNQSVVICPKNNSAITCQSSQFWGEYEVQAFVDINGNGERNAADILLKTIPAVDTSGAVRRFTRPAGVGVVTYGASGLSQSAHKFDIFAVKAGDLDFESRYGRSVCISLPGRPRVVPYSATTCTAF